MCWAFKGTRSPPPPWGHIGRPRGQGRGPGLPSPPDSPEHPEHPPLRPSGGRAAPGLTWRKRAQVLWPSTSRGSTSPNSQGTLSTNLSTGLPLWADGGMKPLAGGPGTTAPTAYPRALLPPAPASALPLPTPSSCIALGASPALLSSSPQIHPPQPRIFLVLGFLT